MLVPITLCVIGRKLYRNNVEEAVNLNNPRETIGCGTKLITPSRKEIKSKNMQLAMHRMLEPVKL